MPAAPFKNIYFLAIKRDNYYSLYAAGLGIENSDYRFESKKHGFFPFSPILTAVFGDFFYRQKKLDRQTQKNTASS